MMHSTESLDKVIRIMVSGVSPYAHFLTIIIIIIIIIIRQLIRRHNMSIKSLQGRRLFGVVGWYRLREHQRCWHQRETTRGTMVSRELGSRRPVNEGQPKWLGVDACENAVPDCQHLAVGLLRPIATGHLLCCLVIIAYSATQCP